jgi:murein DD-endopeptidase MepM/ murein hydrolase activator NlpD
LEFKPSVSFKMPLPGGHRWLVTTEVGGYDCKGGGHDPYHDGDNYFSVDFASRNLADPGKKAYPAGSDIPILAAAAGKVIMSDTSGPNSPNGNFIIIDHDSDGSVKTGFSTRYLHLKNAPARANGKLLKTGDLVAEGEQIGIMGTTGLSTGVHLHFGVRFKDSGAATVPELTKVLMDGLLLKSYQTECSVNYSGIPTDWARYYRSNNTPF